MLQGSGPTDRDSGGYFVPLREHFLSHGLAVLSWDKPGIGESTGHWTNQTLFDRADEALAAVAWLRNDPQIDPARVGIWGQSQDGWVGQLAASQTKDLAFLIVNSGPTIPAMAQDLWGVEHTMREDRSSEQEIRGALQFVGQMHEAAGQGVLYAKVAPKFQEVQESTGFNYFTDVGPDLWHFFIINAQRSYDPVPALSQITCPILAIDGERDSLIPVRKSAQTFESLGAQTGHDITVRIFPGANHRITVGEPRVFAPGYLEMMTDWIWERIDIER
jgi:pimeloyl-ACP methyl ester carboxylesterase